MKRQTFRFAAAVVAAALVGGCGGRNNAPMEDTSRPADEIGGGRLATAEGPAAKAPPVGHVEPLALFGGPMPTGVAASRTGRVFVNFPKWGDDVEFTVAEVHNGRIRAYPDEAINRYQPGKEAQTLVSVQSVVVDPIDRLWILDTGSLLMGPVLPNGPKLVCVDLKTNSVIKKIPIPPSVALKTSYLNDVRFDLRRGAGGTAYITDSSDKGPNGIVVVDLESGRSWRRLNNHPSTRAEPNFVANVEGKPFRVRPRFGSPQPVKMGSDGIAISADGEQIYYTALSGHHLYSVSAAALADERADDAAVAATVKDLGDRGFASDGLEQDAQGRIYLTDYENNAIRRRGTDGTYEIIAQDPQMIWPDTLALAPSGYMYFICNQLNRQGRFHRGADQRQRPFALFRIRVGAAPVNLRSADAAAGGAAPPNGSQR